MRLNNFLPCKKSKSLQPHQHFIEQNTLATQQVFHSLTFTLILLCLHVYVKTLFLHNINSAIVKHRFCQGFIATDLLTIARYGRFVRHWNVTH